MGSECRREGGLIAAGDYDLVNYLDDLDFLEDDAAGKIKIYMTQLLLLDNLLSYNKSILKRTTRSRRV